MRCRRRERRGGGGGGGGAPSEPEADESDDVITGAPGYRVVRCRANSAHIRQSSPDSGHGLQVKVLKIFQVGPSSLGSGGV